MEELANVEIRTDVFIERLDRGGREEGKGREVKDKQDDQIAFIDRGSQGVYSNIRLPQSGTIALSSRVP